MFLDPGWSGAWGGAGRWLKRQITGRPGAFGAPTEQNPPFKEGPLAIPEPSGVGSTVHSTLQPSVLPSHGVSPPVNRSSQNSSKHPPPNLGAVQRGTFVELPLGVLEIAQVQSSAKSSVGTVSEPLGSAPYSPCQAPTPPAAGSVRPAAGHPRRQGVPGWNSPEMREG